MLDCDKTNKFNFIFNKMVQLNICAKCNDTSHALTVLFSTIVLPMIAKNFGYHAFENKLYIFKPLFELSIFMVFLKRIEKRC